MTFNTWKGYVASTLAVSAENRSAGHAICCGRKTSPSPQRVEDCARQHAVTREADLPAVVSHCLSHLSGEL
jgi:hypothetical protein